MPDHLLKRVFVHCNAPWKYNYKMQNVKSALQKEIKNNVQISVHAILEERELCFEWLLRISINNYSMKQL